MKKHLYFLFLLSFPLSLIAQDALWAKYYGDHGFGLEESARAFEFTDDGGYMFVGNTNSGSSGLFDMYVGKTNSSGVLEWSKKYGGGGLEQAFTIEKTADGNFLIAGFTTSFGQGEDAYLIKINPSGDLIWQKNYGYAGSDRIEAAYTAADGGLFLAGWTNISGTKNAWLIKTDADGNKLWDKQYGGSADDIANVVQPTADGGAILIGQTMSMGAGGGDYYLVKTDANGNEEWSKTFGDASIDEGKNVRVLPDGGFIITGDAGDPNYSDVYVVRTDAVGEVIWEQKYGGTGKDASKMIEPTADGGFIIAAITREAATGSEPDGWVIKTDAAGTVEWNKKYGGLRHEHLYMIRAVPDGGYVVVGHTNSYSPITGPSYYMDNQAILFKIDASGNSVVNINENPAPLSVKLFPNPASSGITLNVADISESFDIAINDALGRVVFYQANVRPVSKMQIDVSEFPSGLYSVNVLSSGNTWTSKVVVVHE